jgi:hypothetical protein
MDNDLIKCLEKQKKDLIMNIYENNVDTSIDKQNLCKNSLHCIDNDCHKEHYLDENNRKIITEIINTLDIKDDNKDIHMDELDNPIDINEKEKENVNIVQDDLEKRISILSKEMKEDLKEIKEIELYLDKLKLNLNEKKEKSKELAKEILKLI